MTVCQVEEYYLYMEGLEISAEQKAELELHLSDEGYSDYTFSNEGRELVVDNIPSEHEGETLQDEINNILGY